MATSTYRLVIMLILINLGGALVFAFYNDPATFDTSLVGTYVEVGENFGNNINSETSFTTPENYQQEGSFGNALRIGAKIAAELFRGLIPFPTKYNDFTDPLDVIMILGIELFRILMNLVIGVKLYILFKNKDTN